MVCVGLCVGVGDSVLTVCLCMHTCVVQMQI